MRPILCILFGLSTAVAQNYRVQGPANSNETSLEIKLHIAYSDISRGKPGFRGFTSDPPNYHLEGRMAYRGFHFQDLRDTPYLSWWQESTWTDANEVFSANGSLRTFSGWSGMESTGAGGVGGSNPSFGQDSSEHKNSYSFQGLMPTTLKMFATGGSSGSWSGSTQGIIPPVAYHGGEKESYRWKSQWPPKFLGEPVTTGNYSYNSNHTSISVPPLGDYTDDLTINCPTVLFGGTFDGTYMRTWGTPDDIQTDSAETTASGGGSADIPEFAPWATSDMQLGGEKIRTDYYSAGIEYFEYTQTYSLSKLYPTQTFVKDTISLLLTLPAKEGDALNFPPAGVSASMSAGRWHGSFDEYWAGNPEPYDLATGVTLAWHYLSPEKDGCDLHRCRYWFTSNRGTPQEAPIVDYFRPNDNPLTVEDESANPEEIFVWKWYAGGGAIIQSRTLDGMAEFLSSVDSSAPKNGEFVVSVPTAHVQKLWSDQLTGVTDANFLPNGTGQAEKAYLLMGAAQSSNYDLKGHLKANIQLTCPAELRQKILWRLASGMGTSFNPFDGTSTYGEDGTVTLIVDNPSQSDITYFLVGGVDKDGDGQLSYAEVVFIPKYKWMHTQNNQTVAEDHLFEVKLVDQNSHANAMATLTNDVAVWNFFGLTEAARMLNAFLTQTTPTGATAGGITISRIEPGSSHAIGILFQPPGLSGPSVLATFGPMSEMTQAVLDSDRLYSFLFEHLQTKRQEVADRLNSPGNTDKTFHWIFPGMPSFGFDIFLDSDLALALGKTVLGNVSVNVTVDDLRRIISMTITADITDLYDFDYDAYGDARYGAEVQAGYNTLGNGGRVFKSEIKMINSPLTRLNNFEF